MEEGEHTVEMRYFPKEYKVSLVLFAGGCALFLAILVWDHLRTVKKKKAAVLASATKEPAKSEDAPTSPAEDGTAPENNDQPKGT